MEFVASYWLVWLVGMISCLGFAIWKWVSTMFSVVGDGISIAALGVETANTALDEDKSNKDKGLELAQSAVDRVIDRSSSKVKSFVFGFATLICGWLFGLLFGLSLILNIIDYIKA